jgi:predicted dehydrogenase
VDYEKRELISLSKRAGADGKIEIYGNPVEIKLRDPLEEEIRAFLDSVISRKPPPVSGKDGRDALELALLIAEKARKAQETLP